MIAVEVHFAKVCTAYMLFVGEEGFLFMSHWLTEATCAYSINISCQ